MLDAPLRVLLVEDEARLAASIRRGLEEEGFAVDVAADAADGEAQAFAGGHDLLVVDWRLPHGDGKTLVERYRAAGHRRPVLMLTALADVEHRVAGLDAGADDYLPKPFAFDELVARLRALARRPDTWSLRVGPLEADARRRLATLGGPRGRHTLALRPKEFALLDALMRQPGVAVARADLAETVWGDALYLTDNALDVTVSGLRRAVDDARRAAGAPDAPWIETVRGVGYRLVAGAL